MRTLKFIVDKQIIKKDPDCDFGGLVPGTIGYLKAEFSFSPEWDDTIKVAGFWSGDKECPPQVLADGSTCLIPSEALKNRRFKIQVIGKKDGTMMTTNKVNVRQVGDRV